jgi:hypothetical protein
LEANNQSQFGTAALGIDGSRGNLQLNLSHSSNDTKTNWHLQTRSMMVWTPKSRSISNQTYADSGVFIKNQSTTGGDLNAYIEGYGQHHIKAGNESFIRLEPFKKYLISLHPMDGAALYGDQSKQELVLFPGNVTTINRTFTKITTGFGKLLDSQGQPLANVYIKTDRSTARTNGFGDFQIDIGDTDQVLIMIKSGKTICQAPLPSFKTNGPLIKLGSLVCRPVL